MTPDWWLVGLAFLLGLVLTLAFTVRRAHPVRVPSRPVPEDTPAGGTAVGGESPDPDAPAGN